MSVIIINQHLLLTKIINQFTIMKYIKISLLVLSFVLIGVMASSAGAFSCYASVSCSDGGMVMCNGSESCEATTGSGGSVTCDGKSTQCAPVKKNEQ